MAGKRVLFLGLGSVAAVIAIVGVWLPGVPTVFPLIVALWAFGKSSESLKRRLATLPILRQAIHEADKFEADRSIDKRVKIIAITSAWLSTCVVAAVTRHMVITGIVALSAVACTSVMLYIPTRKRAEAAAESNQE